VNLRQQMKTVFLDLDGTLTDPKPGILRSLCHALDVLGHPMPEGDLDWVIGPPLNETFLRLGVGDVERAIFLYRERYQAIGLFENRVYDGITEALAQLSGAGYRLCIATAKPHAYARRITAHFGLAPFMEAEFGPELDGRRNDKGDLLAHALAVLGLEAQDCLMIGDRIHDMEAARRVGMQAIGVEWGYGTAAELEYASRRCRLPEELPGVVEALAAPA